MDQQALRKQWIYARLIGLLGIIEVELHRSRDPGQTAVPSVRALAHLRYFEELLTEYAGKATVKLNEEIIAGFTVDFRMADEVFWQKYQEEYLRRKVGDIG